MSEIISDEEFAQLRWRLQAKYEEHIRALDVLSEAGADDGPGTPTDMLFRLLGIVTYWRNIKTPPTRQAMADIDKALRSFSVEIIDKASVH